MIYRVTDDRYVRNRDYPFNSIVEKYHAISIQHLPYKEIAFEFPFLSFLLSRETTHDPHSIELRI